MLTYGLSSIIVIFLYMFINFTYSDASVLKFLLNGALQLALWSHIAMVLPISMHVLICSDTQ